MLQFIEATSLPVFDQLKLEEALLRVGTENYCLINWGAPRAIVLGISAKASQMIDRDKWLLDSIPLIRRYSGGGTVLIEPTTVLVSWIINHSFHQQAPYPKEVMQWTLPLWKKMLPDCSIDIRENDYIIGEEKWGGNAQCFTKDRLVHHTSLVWDYTPAYMDYLLMPAKRPIYRGLRSHEHFLCPLKRYFPCQQAFVAMLKKQLSAIFEIKHVSTPSLQAILDAPHRKSTALLGSL